MVKLDPNGCTFYSKKVTFLDNGVLTTQYTDNEQEYASMISKFKHLTDLKVVDVQPTPAQVERLEVLNILELDMVEHWGAEVNEFVKNGFIDPSSTSILENIADDYSVLSKECVLKQYSAQVAAYRYDVEVGGIVYDGMEVKTDRESQSTVASSMMSFMAGVLESINFKFGNGWKVFDATTFPAFAKVFSFHVGNCFASESLVMSQLQEMTLEELLAKDEDNVQVVNVQEMFDAQYQVLSTVTE